MAAKLNKLTHKIAIQLQIVAESCTICSSPPGGQSGNFWIHPRTSFPVAYSWRGVWSSTGTTLPLPWIDMRLVFFFFFSSKSGRFSRKK